MEGTLVKIRADVVTEGALVITCFPSVGMVSSVVGHYLIDNLDLEFVGGVVDPRLPPLTLVTDGKPMPIIRAYAGKPECSIEGCDKIILLMSELVIPSPLVHDIVWALYDWSKGSKIRMGILVDAFSKEGLGGNSGIEEPTVDYDDTEGTDLVGIGATDHVCGMLNDMDWDMAGALGRLLAALKEQGMTADEAFEQIDTDEDGKLNGPELLNGLSSLLGEDLDPAKVSRIITSSDVDVDHRVDLFEGRAMLGPSGEEE